MADCGHLIDSEIFENIEEEYFNLANRAVESDSDEYDSTEDDVLTDAEESNTHQIGDIDSLDDTLTVASNTNSRNKSSDSVNASNTQPNDNDEQFNCKCKCSDSFDQDSLSLHRAYASSLTKQELDLMILSKVSTFINNGGQTNCSKRWKQSERKRSRCNFHHEG